MKPIPDLADYLCSAICPHGECRCAWKRNIKDWCARQRSIVEAALKARAAA